MSTNITNAIQGGNITMSKATLTTPSGAATTITTGLAFGYTIGGIFRAAKSAGTYATPTTDISTGKTFNPIKPNTACVFVLSVDAAGTVRASQGQVVAWDGITPTVCPFPQLPDTVAPFAYFVVKGGSTVAANWQFGASNWNATGITVDPAQDVMLLPPNDPITV